MLFIVCLILVGGLGGYGTYSFYAQNATAQDTIARLETQLGDLSKSVQVSEDQKKLMQEQINKLNCKTFWRNNECAPQSEMATVSAQPVSGVSPLKVKFSVRAPSLAYNLDFGDASSTPLTSAQTPNADGGCTQDKDGLCTIVVSHTYTSPETATFTAKVMKDDAVVSSVSIAVRGK